MILWKYFYLIQQKHINRWKVSKHGVQKLNKWPCASRWIKDEAKVNVFITNSILKNDPVESPLWCNHGKPWQSNWRIIVFVVFKSHAVLWVWHRSHGQNKFFVLLKYCYQTDWVTTFSPTHVEPMLWLFLK